MQTQIPPEESRRQKILLSIVVPCFDEEEVLHETHRRLTEAFEREPSVQLEIVYVDDGSRDRTLDLLRGLQRLDRRVRVVAFSRNFGHQFAVTAGLDHCAGDAVCVIDADLQDPPEVILAMLERWRDGVDVAYGVRTEREGESPFKQWTAKLFYRTINRMSDTVIPLDTGDFRLMDRAAVEAFQAMPERDRFVRGMVAWAGFRQEAVPYRRAARFAGTTKYPLKKMLRFAADGILSFSIAPLRMAIYAGLCAAAVSLLGVVYALALRLATSNWVEGWTLLFIAVLFIGGVQLVFMGVMGEYIGRIYGEVKRRPLYVVKEQLGFEPLASPPCSLANAIRTPEAIVHPPRQAARAALAAADAERAA
jgi:glycosyltransferase involved in cell wall biosynthesis